VNVGYLLVINLEGSVMNRMHIFTLTCLAVVLIAAFYAGLSAYGEFIKIPPACALDNHHGPGNCPVRLLRWYPMSAIEGWRLDSVREGSPTAFAAKRWLSLGERDREQPR
jgi:hypothetical protein